MCGERFSDECIYRESGDCLDPIYRHDFNGPTTLESQLDFIGFMATADTGSYFCVPATARTCPVPGHSALAVLEFDRWVAYIFDASGEEVAWLWECNEDCPPGPCVTVFFGDPVLEDCARKAMRETLERTFTPFGCGDFVGSMAECPDECLQIEDGLL
jgi:hypothetical protein